MGSVDAYLYHSQRTLDASLVALPPVFTKTGLMDYILALIVTEDDVSLLCSSLVPELIIGQAIQLVDKEPFRDLMRYLRPTLRESDMPHCTKTHGEIMERAKLVVERVKDNLQV